MSEPASVATDSERGAAFLFLPSLNIIFPVGATEIIGSGGKSTIRLAGVRCASEHFEIDNRDTGYFLRSLSPASPTRVNGRLEIEVALSQGDVISFGNLAAVFLSKAPNFPDLQSPSVYIPHRNAFTPITRQIVIGRGADADVSFDRDNSCSRQQFSVAPRGGDLILEQISPRVPTHVNSDQVKGRQIVRPGDRISFGSHVAFIVRDLPSVGSTHHLAGVADSLDVPERKTRPPRSQTVDRKHGDAPLDGYRTIGRDEAADICLDHPTVSRWHARLYDDAGELVLEDLGSLNGTFLNGERVSRVPIGQGDRIDIGPFSLTYEKLALVQRSRENNVTLVARSLVKSVGAGTKRQNILNDVSVVIEPGEFVCILGPTGSGKSTLLNALSAQTPADTGGVWINGDHLYDHFELLKQDIAYVSQDNLLREELTLRRALTFTGELRLPRGTSSLQISAEISRVLRDVELERQIDSRLATFSGGQKKRASLANEILCGPSLIFLDEVTSGLDEKTDFEMMKLCRKLADQRKTVICVTHSVANVINFATKIVILQFGGWLAFYGTPQEALEFFRVTRLGEIYDSIDGVGGRALATDYFLSPFAHSHLHRKLTEFVPSPNKTPSNMVPSVRRQVAETWRQLKILFRRHIEILLADRKSMAIALGQSIVIAVILWLIFQSMTPEESQRSLLFLLAICALWFGCNNAAKEIVKERRLYERERDVNLSIVAYIFAKGTLFGLLATAQVLVLGLIVDRLVGVPGNLYAQCLVLALAANTGTALGLLISSVVRTRDQANTLIPLALIPQIALSGVIVPNMPPLAEALAKIFISGYWANQALEDVTSHNSDELLFAVLALFLQAAVLYAAATTTLIKTKRTPIATAAFLILKKLLHT